MADARELTRIGQVLNSGAVPTPVETRVVVDRVGELVAALLDGEAN